MLPFSLLRLQQLPQHLPAQHHHGVRQGRKSLLISKGHNMTAQRCCLFVADLRIWRTAVIGDTPCCSLTVPVSGSACSSIEQPYSARINATISMES